MSDHPYDERCTCDQCAVRQELADRIAELEAQASGLEDLHRKQLETIELAGKSYEAQRDRIRELEALLPGIDELRAKNKELEDALDTDVEMLACSNCKEHEARGAELEAERVQMKSFWKSEEECHLKTAERVAQLDQEKAMWNRECLRANAKAVEVMKERYGLSARVSQLEKAAGKVTRAFFEHDMVAEGLWDRIRELDTFLKRTRHGANENANDARRANAGSAIIYGPNDPPAVATVGDAVAPRQETAVSASAERVAGIDQDMAPKAKGRKVAPEGPATSKSVQDWHLNNPLVDDNGKRITLPPEEEEAAQVSCGCVIVGPGRAEGICPHGNKLRQAGEGADGK